MYVDKFMLFSDAQAVTASAASTDYADLLAVRNIGVGENLYVVVTVDVALTDGDSNSTVQVSLEGDSATTFTPDGSQVLFTIPALAAAGAKYIARISPDFASNYRYIRLYYTVAGGNLTTGTFTAFITHNVDAYTSYADGIYIAS
jgi:hypothetical protein